MVAIDRDRIIELLDELSRRLGEADVAARIYIVGGAAIALDWDTRRSTHDIDAVLHPRETVRSVAAAMASEHRMPPDWLTDAASAFVPPRPTSRRPQVVARHGDVEIVTAPAEHLLAMKMAAFRQGDMEDLRVLVRHLQLSTPEAVADACQTVYGPDAQALPERPDLLWQAQVVLDSL